MSVFPGVIEETSSEASDYPTALLQIQSLAQAPHTRPRRRYDKIKETQQTQIYKGKAAKANVS